MRADINQPGPGFHCRSAGETPLNLALMRPIGVQFLGTPWYGSRQMPSSPRRLHGRTQADSPADGQNGTGADLSTSSDNDPGIGFHPNLLRDMAIDRPNQVWCADITYIPIRRGFQYLIAIMDWSTRKVLAWRLSNTMDADFCIEALEEALMRFGPPEIFNTDQGSQFTSPRFTGVLNVGSSGWPDPWFGFTACADVDLSALRTMPAG